MQAQAGKPWERIAMTVLIVLVAAAFLFPIAWMLSTALKAPEDIFTPTPSLLPETWHWHNFADAWKAQPFAKYFANTLIVVLVSTPFAMLSSTMVAFGFARISFWGRNALFLLVIGTMVIPWDVTAIPLYIEYNKLGLINTLWPMILPGMFGAPFFIFLARQFIMGIPHDLDEAAKIDGCSRWQIYWKIVLPLCRPVVVVIGVFHFVWVWNEFLTPLIFINDQDLYTLPLGINLFKNAYNIEYEKLMAISCLSVLFPVTLFYFTQNLVLGGLSLSGVKK
ncbi:MULTISPECIES: carbohydrate ABC transporter permease [Cohnella]|jgi:multiple sugar transport system permease protein|uniref:carbohydrate ABC transporter permease n=1 Tax=Cohnella TaxID=329857 RepID=UPI00037817BD|nr:MULTISPECIES: carbohydrate ABC transporter permease [Cohnella]REK65054.1 MAG: carbohydrate ABC transporter permease [Cohnella sp.]